MDASEDEGGRSSRVMAHSTGNVAENATASAKTRSSKSTARTPPPLHRNAIPRGAVGQRGAEDDCGGVYTREARMAMRERVAGMDDG